MLVVVEIGRHVEMAAEIVAAAGVLEVVVDVGVVAADVLVVGAEIAGAVGVRVAAVVVDGTRRSCHGSTRIPRINLHAG